LEAVKLGEQVAAAVLIVSGVLLGGRADRVEDEIAELGVGLEGV
jgi:hypothetical protein